MPNVNEASFSTVNQGMPDMPAPINAVSRFEFWPTWVFYTPVVLQSILCGIRYGDFRLPLVANPAIRLSGMVGESKADILTLAGDYAKEWIPHFVTLTKKETSAEEQLQHALEQMQQADLHLPIVAKPDQGCRGRGVQLIKSKDELKQYIVEFPNDARYLLQKLSSYHAEAGIFYIRYPNEKKGRVFSITLKYSPYVVGDGKQTLKELIYTDSRAKQLAHLYLPRHEALLDTVITKGEVFQLAFAGSHSLGCIFKNGNRFITDALSERLDTIFDDYPGYCFGRLDVKFKDIDSLMAGTDFEILEMNGSSSEAGHIWDSDTPLKEIFSTLLYQYRCLYKIGYLQKKSGHQVPSFKELFSAMKHEKALIEQYPATD